MELGDNFCYLGRIFDYEDSDKVAKEQIRGKLSDLLNITDSLRQ